MTKSSLYTVLTLLALLIGLEVVFISEVYCSQNY